MAYISFRSSSGGGSTPSATVTAIVTAVSPVVISTSVEWIPISRLSKTCYQHLARDEGKEPHLRHWHGCAQTNESEKKEQCAR